MRDKVRQAVVVIHGMGEQRPLDTLNGFIDAALPPTSGGKPFFYSRPDRITDSYESRRYLAPRQPLVGEPERYAQTEFFEYHWAHLMKGNRLDDLWPTLRRMLLQLPRRVPANLRLIWALFWLLVIWVVWAWLWGPLSEVDVGDLSASKVVGVLVGGGVTIAVLTYVVARVLPGWITGSFVDVVRYLDTSPRSYEVRREIRNGIVELLRGLHDSGRYQRIVIVAHSLGSYIAYDAISYLWGQMNRTRTEAGTSTGDDPGRSPRGLRELEQAASDLNGGGDVEAFRAAQRELWLGLHERGDPWLISDFVSLGSPMYFADQLYTKNRRQFDERVEKRELPTCPPRPELAVGNNINRTRLWYSWNNGGVRDLYHGAPFAVVRWTNLWFPSRFGFFGDWFGGPLGPLFGRGIKDVAVVGNRPGRLIPAYAHALYFRLDGSNETGTVRYGLRDAIDLASTSWLTATAKLAHAEADPS
jgi:hypothetical protein